MEKPIILIEKEFNEELSRLVNNYVQQLPASMMLNSFNSVSASLSTIAEQQLKQAEEMYNKSLEEENKESEVIEDAG